MKNELEFLCDLILHSSEVSENLEVFSSELRKRGLAHDRTKFQSFEFDRFLSGWEDFKKTDYGTEKYNESPDKVTEAREHHHENNRHHVGFYENGVEGMNLIDVLEMLSDWKAAARRSPNLNLEQTLDKAFDLYGIKDEQLRKVILNTFKYLGWVSSTNRRDDV